MQNKNKLVREYQWAKSDGKKVCIDDIIDVLSLKVELCPEVFSDKINKAASDLVKYFAGLGVFLYQSAFLQS